MGERCSTRVFTWSVRFLISVSDFLKDWLDRFTRWGMLWMSCRNSLAAYTNLGRMKEKHVKNTVVMSIVAVAGLASSALAQPYTYETRLVLDNDPLLASLGINYGTNALLPGNDVAGVGITLLVRVTSTVSTNPVFGLSSIQGGGNPSAPNARFTHNDSVSNQTNALWSSPSLAFQRGVTTVAGQLGAINTGTGNNFRQAISAAAENNTPRTNVPGTTQPLDTATNGASAAFPVAGVTASTYTTGGAGNANGWFGPIGAAGTTGTIAGLNLSANNGTGGVNYSGNDQDQSLAGTQAPWQALYHLVFVPRFNSPATGSDSARNVTVNFSGYARAAVTSTYGAGTSQTANPTTAVSASITFQVPTPGAAALLGLGGIFAGRRRRA